MPLSVPRASLIAVGAGRGPRLPMALPTLQRLLCSLYTHQATGVFILPAWGDPTHPPLPAVDWRSAATKKPDRVWPAKNVARIFIHGLPSPRWSPEFCSRRVLRPWHLMHSVWPFATSYRSPPLLTGLTWSAWGGGPGGPHITPQCWHCHASLVSTANRHARCLLSVYPLA